jgi:hypothetical protein
MYLMIIISVAWFVTDWRRKWNAFTTVFQFTYEALDPSRGEVVSKTMSLVLSELSQLVVGFTYCYENEMSHWCNKSPPVLNELGPAFKRVYSLLQSFVKVGVSNLLDTVFGRVAQSVSGWLHGVCGRVSSYRVPTLCYHLLSHWHSSNFVLFIWTHWKMCMWLFGSVRTFFKQFTCSCTLSILAGLHKVHLAYTMVNAGRASLIGYLLCVINSSHTF